MQIEVVGLEVAHADVSAGFNRRADGCVAAECVVLTSRMRGWNRLRSKARSRPSSPPSTTMKAKSIAPGVNRDWSFACRASTLVSGAAGGAEGGVNYPAQCAAADEFGGEVADVRRGLGCRGGSGGFVFEQHLVVVMPDRVAASGRGPSGRQQ